jgi:methanogenic corrinoid protein MtbC1
MDVVYGKIEKKANRCDFGDRNVVNEQILERYLRGLLEGNRLGCRAVIEEALQMSIPAAVVYTEVIWPIMMEIERLFNAEKINSAQEHMAMRINRSIVDQLQNKLPRRPAKSKRVVVCSAATEHGELGAQIIADLFESDGWQVRFLGGGVSDDDMLSFVHERRPDMLLIYGTIAQRAPAIRKLINRIKEVDAVPQMQIMVSGGVFNRAEGLWDEIGADLFAPNASEALRVSAGAEEGGIDTHNGPVPRDGRRRRRKSRMVS